MAPPPFLIAALPRSRTAWLARWLAGPNRERLVGHDTAIHVRTVDQFLDQLVPGVGLVETGVQDGLGVIDLVRPVVRRVVVLRDPTKAAISLMTAGWPDMSVELHRRHAVLASAPGCTTVSYSDLSDVHCCSWLWEHLLERPFDFDWWQRCDAENIQIDLAERRQVLEARKAEIGELVADLARVNAEIAEGDWCRVGLEPWDTLFPDAADQAQLLFSAVYGPDAGTLAMNHGLIRQLEQSGQFQALGARVNSRLVGWVTWSIGPDLERSGKIVANQGGFWVDPGQARRGLGMKLLTRSLDLFRRLGVTEFEFHDRPHGRGARMFTLFKRLGAIESKTSYSLRIGQ